MLLLRVVESGAVGDLGGYFTESGLGHADLEGVTRGDGGRVLGVTATAATLPEALKKAYAAADCIHFDKLHRRSDIGARALAAMKAQEG